MKACGPEFMQKHKEFEDKKKSDQTFAFEIIAAWMTCFADSDTDKDNKLNAEEYCNYHVAWGNIVKEKWL